MKIKHLIILLSITFLPISVSAATVYLDSAHESISVGDIVIVNVRASSDGTSLNTIEGSINLTANGTLVVRDTSTAGSVFGFWPVSPTLSNNNNSVSFVGGVPGGFNSKNASLFKIVIEATKEGNVTFTPGQILAYANDGKGTKVPVKSESLTIHVGPKGASSSNEWLKVVGTDSIPPESFSISLGQDNSMFSGKKFIFFNAVDNQSGISYYDVSENGLTAIRSGNTYVLRNQNDDVMLTVTAYDKAGNKRVETLKVSPNNNQINWVSIIVVILVIIALRIIYKKWKKSKKNVSSKL